MKTMNSDIRPIAPGQFSNSGFWLSPGFFDDNYDHFGSGEIIKKRGVDVMIKISIPL